MRRYDAQVLLGRIAAFACLAMSFGCGGKHYLNQYDFSGKSLALVYIEPPEPELLHGLYDVDVNGSAIQTVLQAGSKVAKEVIARRASARLDTAARRVDVSARLAKRTLERAGRYLGTRTVETQQGADYVLEVYMRAFGIDATSNRATYLYTRAEAVLIDRRTGREIWSEDVRGSDRLTPYVQGTLDAPSAVFTAVTLQNVTVADFERALEQLTTLTSNVITAELREKLRDVRDR